MRVTPPSCTVPRLKVQNSRIVADDQLGRLAAVLHVLRCSAEAGVRKNAVVTADPGRAFDDGMSADHSALAYLDPGADHGKGADCDRTRQRGGRVDDGGWMNQPHALR